ALSQTFHAYLEFSRVSASRCATSFFSFNTANRISATLSCRLPSTLILVSAVRRHSLLPFPLISADSRIRIPPHCIGLGRSGSVRCWPRSRSRGCDPSTRSCFFSKHHVHHW